MFDSFKDMYDGASRKASAAMDEKMVKHHDAIAERAIRLHGMAVTSIPSQKNALFRGAQEACREVMLAACDADGAIPQHIDRVMRLAEYRVKGHVTRDDIAAIMQLPNAQLRKEQFETLFDRIATQV